jgi:demethylmenaquinone methyltransferase / 2-methoxy-6-polyprenyl-1,4-benzoquinol methylase
MGYDSHPATIRTATKRMNKKEIPRETRDSIAPHPVLTGYYPMQDDRVPYVRRLFDITAPSYDRINAWMSLRTGEQYRLDALRRAGIAPNQWALDIATGTGVMAAHETDLVGAMGGVIAIDPSLPMLREAGKRGIVLRVGGIAEALPLMDGSVDFISMGYALRHVADLRLAFGEFHRALKPGGRLLILEMVPPPSRIGYSLTRLYLKHLVPAITALVTRNQDAHRLMQYYWDTIDQCVAPEVIEATLTAAGFTRVKRSVRFAIMNEYTAVRSGT